MLSKKLIFIVKWIIFGLILFILLLALAIGFFEYKYSNKFYPGVMINGKSMAGKTYDAVLREFKTKSDSLQKNGLNLVFSGMNGKTEINIPEATTGLTPDTLVEYFYIGNFQEVVSNAYNWGHKGNFIQRLKEQCTSLLSKNFNYSVSPHKEAIKSLITRGKTYFFTVEVPAQFSLGDNNEVIIIPEKSGDDIDVEKITNIVIQKLNTFDVEPVIFNVQQKTPYPTEAMLKPYLDFAKEFKKSANVNFNYKNNKWRVNGKTLVAWLTLKTNNKITVNNKKLEAFLFNSVVPLINDPVQNSRFEIKDGKLVETFVGKSGNIADINKAVGSLEKIISPMQQSFIATGNISFNLENNIIDIPIETTTADPQITQKTIDKYEIKDLVGRAQTNFTGGSLDRQHNIEVGVSKMTGVLIAPGEEFSTVQALGDITEEAGFVKEYVINGDQTVKELGGGLCQLATTLFRTTLNAGLPITERLSHKYVIPFYGPGVDATIYGPHPDFRFVNDTGNYLLLQGTAKNNEVTFELYGVSDGRIAEISTPVLSNEQPVPPTRNIMTQDLPTGETKCQTATHKGITADTTYTVTYPNGSKKEKVFHSVYEAWPKVCLIGI
ncbi:MAG: VanW family protein [Candidatus Staskawiczbacteria bacterium]|nr:VanW family protein [Candidatus Staskawiczbacteria bacterium]